ncbi:MAG: hypothetical protein A2285_07370 [Elusimicrobia bacterium RIFOXYA12_FULL_57_11]|nr:MAG: hypothetical protein A2285_07370 [Elusimicrobia bacterium RIFOXYA12_FULL_57_11]
MKRLAFCLTLLLYPVACAFAGDFTRFRPGVRANAMGTAFSTIEGDPFAVFYNPANLTTLTNLEARFETGRRLSPVANKGEASIAYARPLPGQKNRVAGLGYYASRSRATLSMDSLQGAFGDRTTIKYFQRPLFYGGGAKIVSLRYPGQNQLGLGFDAGALLASDSGLRTALVLSDIIVGLGKTGATLTLGNSYIFGETTVLADFRTRGTYSELYFGAEHPLFNGLVQARAGKGVSLDGGGYLALGAGLNILPWTLDFAFSIPVSGYSSSAGYYGVNLGYRFGAAAFSENLVGDAARRVENLKMQNADLRAQRDNLENSIATYRVNKGTLETDLTLMQSRAREMEENLKEIQLRTLEAVYAKEHAKPAKRAFPQAPPEKWPKRHKVEPGETLRSLASKYYGNPNLWERVYEANESLVIKGLPSEGAVFTIPAPPPAHK